jgi:translation elongation factor EF-Ts
MVIEAEKIMTVHRETGWPVRICRQVLVQNSGDVEASVRTLKNRYKTYLTEEQKAELDRTGSWVDKLSGDA